MGKWAPSSIVDRNARAAEKIVLLHASTIETAGIGDHPDVGMASQRKRFERAVPSLVALGVGGVRELAVGNSAVNVAIRKKSVELCRHRDREQQETQKCQCSGSRLGHELFLPGGCAGKKCHLINEIR